MTPPTKEQRARWRKMRGSERTEIVPILLDAIDELEARAEAAENRRAQIDMATSIVANDLAALQIERDRYRAGAMEQSEAQQCAIRRAERAEKDRDEAWNALRERASAIGKADKVYLKEIEKLHSDVALHKIGHEGQTRNTMAFYDDCEKLKAELREARSKALEESAEICAQAARDSCVPCWERIRALKQLTADRVNVTLLGQSVLDPECECGHGLAKHATPGCECVHSDDGGESYCNCDFFKPRGETK
jgi:hypothetical protein